LAFLILPTFAAAAPVINSLTPNTGAIDSAIVIAGSGFGTSQSKVTVKFNGTTATITSFSSSSITAKVPTGATTGNVVVTVSGTASTGVLFTVTPAPSITSLTPSTGAVGSSIVIAGSNFGSSQGNGKVTFSGTTATVSSWGVNSITATVPTGAATGNVVVTAAGGVASTGVTFTVTPAPSITSLTPSSGAVGSSIVIAGSNFGSPQGNGTVTFNGTVATVTNWAVNSITATVPSGATTGNVIVTAAGGVATTGVTFTVTPAPGITSLTPSTGAVGSAIVIAGSNFGSSQGNGKVTFNGTTATVTNWTGGSITATVPTGATTGNVVVTAAGGVASNVVSFTVTPAPNISSLSASSGPVGSAVTITGSNFGPTQGNGSVTFNGTAATISSWAAGSITATVPSNATTGNVMVTAAGGVQSNAVSFTVTPAITSLTPSSGAVGSVIVIAGTSFGSTQGSSTVTFNGTAATSISSWTNSSISATVPAGATTGNVLVTVSGNASTGVSFTVTSAPSITSVTPNSGAVGSSIVIAGSNFGSTQGNGSVTFNGASATITNWSSSSITATVPSTATTGNVVVTAAGGVSSSGVTFTVTSAPSITSLTPNSGAVGSSVVIAGSNFGSSQGNGGVTFNGTSATITNWGASSITATAPNGATTGNVVVTAAGGVSSSGVTFTVTSAASISSLTPNSGAVGSSVVIAGSNFGSSQGNGGVTFNGTSATITNWGASSITATVPSGATTGNVVVTAPGGVASNGVTFTVTPAPSISNLNPNAGAVNSSVIISGSNFGGSQGNGKVTFNGLSATVTNWGASSITATVPSAATTGNVVVTAAGGVQSNAVLFTVAPFITSLSNSSAEPGMAITITGNNFTSTGGVNFNGQATSYSSWSNTSIQVTVPFGANSGNVTVTAAGLQSNGINFTVLAPTIASLNPSSGVYGTAVAISGSNFGTSAGTVAFNGQSAAVTSWSDSSITATVPSNASTGNVVVSNGGLQSNGANFTVSVPSITGLSPSSGSSGTQVTISGTNFGGNTGTVTFNGTSATIVSWSANSIVAVAPSGVTSGNLVVITAGGSTSNGVFFAATGTVIYGYDSLGRLISVTSNTGDAAQYNYDAVGNILSIQRYSSAQVSVISFTPAQGVAGASVTINGSGFSTTASQNTVQFNGTSATVTSSTANQIIALVPVGSSSGAITVTSPSGSASSSASFTVLPSSGAPTISGFTPTIASTGAAINITGTNFDVSPPNDRLTVDTTTPLVPVNSPAPTATAMTLILPGSVGSGHIALTTPGGSTVSTGDLYVEPPFYGSTPVSYNARISLNNSIAVSIPSNNVGLLVFDGVAGRSISIATSSSGSAGYTFVVYDPHENVFQRLFSCQFSCFVDSAPLPLTGTYTMAVTGNFSFTLYDSTPITANIPTNGTPLTVGLYSGQNAVFNFNAIAGQQAVVQFSNNTINNYSVVATIINPDGTTLFSRQFSGSLALQPLMVPETGVYTLVIDPQSLGAGSITTALTLQGNGATSPPSRPAGSVIDPGNSLSTHLVGLFVMNEGSGTIDLNLVDEQTASFSGTGVPTWNTNDPSILFNGGGSLNSYLNAGTDLNFDQLPTSQITVVGKVFLNAMAAGGLAEKNNSSGGAGSGFGFLFDGSGSIRMFVGKSSSNLFAETASNAIIAGTWVQLALTWDGTIGNTSAVHMFVNGVEQTKVASDNGLGILDYTGATNQPFRIGNVSWLSSGSLNGKMAYLAVYRGRILTTTELAQLDAQLPINNVDVSATITPNSGATAVTTTQAGQNARLTFSATAGQDVAVQITGNTMGSAAVSLLNPDGTTVTSTTSSAASFNLAPMVVSMTGTYAIYIRPANPGSMQVSAAVTNLPSRPVGAVLDTTNPLSTNLVGLFVMNEGSGTTDQNLVDGQTASLSGTTLPTWNTSDPSILFNGGGSLNSYLNAGTDLIFDQLPVSQITVVAKVYLNSLTLEGIAEKNDGDTSGSGFVFAFAGGSFGLDLIVEKSAGDMSVTTAPTCVPTGQWVQVGFTWDGTIGTAAAAHLFVNGIEQPKLTSNNGGGSIGYANATNKPFRIGNASFGAPGSLNGKMAYLAVYKGRILSSAEMSQLDAQLPIQ
jgi:YD repeat-containing protein